MPQSTRQPGAAADALRFEALLSRLSATFIHQPADEVDGQIEHALQQVVELLNIERSSLGQFSPDGRQLIVTHSYTVAGYPPMPRIDLGTIWPWYVEQIRQGRVLRFARLPEELPREAFTEQQSYKKGEHPRSHLLVPFRVGEAVLGGIGFGSYRREIEWDDDVVMRLQLLGEVFANALARKVALEKESRLREQLAIAARVALMGELAASIAHEINQPLCALASGADTLRRFLRSTSPDVESARSIAEDLASDALRAGEIVRRVRELFRASPPEARQIDLNAVIREATSLVRAETTRRGVTVRLALGEGLPEVRGDHVGLIQVILNLLSNGADALADQPRGHRDILIRTEPDGLHAVRASIRDNGPGLDPRDVDRIFDAFFTTKPGGMGMGLAVCKSIIQRHGGRIWAERQDGSGTTFHFTLPAQECAP